MAKAKRAQSKEAEPKAPRSPAYIPADNPHGEFWNKWCETPSNYTKKFTRSGGFSGDSIDPIYRLKMLTEAFGIVGKFWTFVQEDQWTDGATGGYIVYVRGHLRWREQLGDGSFSEWYCTPSHTGGTLVRDKSADEAYKMAETDALGKCCVDLGIAVDVYLGIHDADKYQRESDGSPAKFHREDARQPRGRGGGKNKAEPRKPAAPIPLEEVELLQQQITACQDDPAILALSRTLFNRLMVSRELPSEKKEELGQAMLTRRVGLVSKEMLPGFKSAIDACRQQNFVSEGTADELWKLAQSRCNVTPGEE